MAENPQSKVSANILSAPFRACKLSAGPVFFEAHEIFCQLKQVNLAGILNPSSSSMDGQGTLTAGLLRFGAVEARNLDSKLRLESRHVFVTDIKAEVYGGSAAGTLLRFVGEECEL
jgi:hypothetical protein